MKINLSDKRLFGPALGFVLVYLSAIVGLFFATLNTYGSDYSWGDVDFYHQGLYNFWNGKLFQTSLYRIPSNGEISSPYAYAHAFTIHMNIMNYLAAFPYKFLPSLNTFYAIPILYNVLGVITFCCAMAYCPATPETTIANPDLKRNVVVLLVGLFLLWGTFYAAITYKGHAPIYATPLFLASYFFFQRKRYFPFFLCSLAVCLIQEDCALWMASYALCLLLLTKRRHFTLYALILISLGYFLIVSFWLQKDAKWYLDSMQYRSDLSMTWHVVVLNPLANGSQFVHTLIDDLRLIASNIGFIAVVLWGMRKYVKPSALEWGLLLIAPFPHYVSLFIGRGGPHHFIPIIGSIVVVITQMALRAVASQPTGRFIFYVEKRIGLLFGSLLLGTYLLSNFILCLNGYILMRAYGVLNSAFYNPAKTTANRHVALTIELLLPSSASLCFWTARDVSAFIANRSNIWRFPYAFDTTDYLVIQKRVNDSFVEFRQPLKDLNLKELAANNQDPRTVREFRYCSSMDPCHILATDTDFFKHLLVDQRDTHRVFYEDMDLLILQSKVHHSMYIPPFTERVYWR